MVFEIRSDSTNTSETVTSYIKNESKIKIVSDCSDDSNKKKRKMSDTLQALSSYHYFFIILFFIHESLPFTPYLFVSILKARVWQVHLH